MVDTEFSLSDSTIPVLIVDDNLQYTQVLRKILAAAFGYQNIASVDSVSSGYDLLKQRTTQFRLLFIDYRFPDGSNGAELLERLHAEGLLTGLFAFLITSEPSVEIMKRAVAAGAVGVVAKPFDREELKRQLALAERMLRSQSEDSF